MRFDVYRDEAGEYRWRIRARNGRILADSGQGYNSERACREAVSLIEANVEFEIID